MSALTAEEEARLLFHAQNSPYRLGSFPEEETIFYNEACGDCLAYAWKKESLYFYAEGCLLSRASASLACFFVERVLTNKDDPNQREDLKKHLFTLLSDLEEGHKSSLEVHPESFLFFPFFQFPKRLACIKLAWKSLEDFILQDKL